MKKTVFKAAFAALLICSLVLCFASCGSTSATLPDADDMDGKIDGTDIEWSYDKDDKVLTVEGTGEIPDCDAPEDVWWYDARHNIEEIEISEGITSIGNYAFYYCPELTDVEIPVSVTSIGDLAFAFCSSLKSIELGENVSYVGDSCFEACIALEGIYVPASVTYLGERAFAHCSALEDAVIMAQISEIKDWTFMGCTSLDAISFSEAVRNVEVADNAFEDAKSDFDDAEFTASLTGEVTLTVKYVYEDGTTAAEDKVELHKRGSSYSVVSPTIEDYTADKLTVTGVISGDTTETVTYKLNADVTETEEQTEAEREVVAEEEDEGVTVGTVITIVIFAVVIIAIIVLAIVMMRSDKKANNASKGAKNNSKKK